MLSTMIRLPFFRSACIAFALTCIAVPHAALAIDVRICTDRGVIELALDERTAPRHALGFAALVEEGFYSGTVFHRVVPGSMVQGGRFTTDMARRSAAESWPNSAPGSLSNLRGTISAPSGPGTGNAEFFINLDNNTRLDLSPGGYTVFGRVTTGLEILDQISQAPTSSAGELTELPLSPVELISVTTLTGDSNSSLPVADNPAATLAAIDQLRSECAPLNSSQFLAEATAATDLRRFDRARYSLEQYLAGSSRADPLLPRMQRMYAELPRAGSNNVTERTAHCRRPLAPSIPNAAQADLASLRTIERAMRSFLQNGEFYLRCISQVIDSGTLNEVETIDATKLHNDMVIELTAVATRFNAVARAFKEAND